MRHAVRTPEGRIALPLDTFVRIMGRWHLGAQEHCPVDKEYKALARTVGHDVAASYQDVKPLLLENEAISRFTQAQPMYREALPEVTSIAEALILASMERPLSQTQQKLLKMLLAADLA